MNTLPFTTFRFASALLLAGALLTTASASAGDVHTVVGAGVGAMAGAAIGQSVGGHDGAVVGAVAGTVIGAGLGHNAGHYRDYPQPRSYSPPPPYPVYRSAVPVYVEPPPVVYSERYYWRAEPYYPRHRHHHHHYRGHGPRDYSPGYYGGRGGGRDHRW